MTKKAPKPHKMWIIAIQFGNRMWPLAGFLSYQRKEAIKHCEKELGQSWAELRKEHKYHCVKVAIAPEPRP